jgi:hypothetical protein
MKCLKCGYLNENGKDYCEKCGNSLQTTIEEIDIEPYISHKLTEEDKAKAKDILKKGIVSFVIGILIIIIIINFYLSNYNDLSLVILIISLIPVVVILAYGITMIVRGINNLSSDVSDSITNIIESPESSKIENVVVKYSKLSAIIGGGIFSVIWLMFMVFITRICISDWEGKGKPFLFILIVFWAVWLFITIYTIVDIKKYLDNYKK